jgi:hypothetical protein
MSMSRGWGTAAESRVTNHCRHLTAGQQLHRLLRQGNADRVRRRHRAARREIRHHPGGGLRHLLRALCRTGHRIHLRGCPRLLVRSTQASAHGCTGKPPKYRAWTWPACSARLVSSRVRDAALPRAGACQRHGPRDLRGAGHQPPGASGIAAEDLVTATDGLTFDREALKWAIAHQQTVGLSVARGNQPLTYQIPVGQRSQIGRLTWLGDDRQADLI